MNVVKPSVVVLFVVNNLVLISCILFAYKNYVDMCVQMQLDNHRDASICLLTRRFEHKVMDLTATIEEHISMTNSYLARLIDIAYDNSSRTFESSVNLVNNNVEKLQNNISQIPSEIHNRTMSYLNQKHLELTNLRNEAHDHVLGHYQKLNDMIYSTAYSWRDGIHRTTSNVTGMVYDYKRWTNETVTNNAREIRDHVCNVIKSMFLFYIDNVGRFYTVMAGLTTVVLYIAM